MFAFPNLRFPGFEGEWKTTTLGEIGQVINGLTYSPNDIDENGILVLRSSNVQNRIITFEDNVFVKAENFNPVKENDILICVRNGSKNLIGKNSLIKKENEGLAFGAFMAIYRSEFNRFLFQWFDTNDYKEIVNKNLGATINSINGGDLKKFTVPFPSLYEQEKISSFLSLIDERILSQKKIIEGLSLQKISIVKKLFENKIKFKTNSKTQNWERKKLAEISEEHLHKNPNNKYNEVFSVAKHKGVINQIEHLGRSFSAKEILHYKLVYPGDLVYTKSPTSDFPFGIIKQNRTGRIGVVSPLYCVFTPKTYVLGYLLHEYFNSAVNTFNYLNPLVQKGAKNTMNINNETFLNGASILLPMNKEEQEKVYKFLLALDEKINLENELLTRYENQKKYLLQNLFV
ncbi:restriction endonuclease subunit S [Chryseobacterium sp. EZn1]|uniref:restriction endonuclease subunit S n=1 Tax=Chryseobacterium cupriresistens TaxID=3366770 RepID=UPI003984A4D4